MGKIDGIGKLKQVDKFDATFFMTHPKLAENMDPLTRIFLETSIEAVFDAGLSLTDLYGTNTAVFSTWCISDTEMFTSEEFSSTSFGMLGRSRTMQANRVSYILNLLGKQYLFEIIIMKKIIQYCMTITSLHNKVPVTMWMEDGIVLLTVWKKQNK